MADVGLTADSPTGKQQTMISESLIDPAERAACILRQMLKYTRQMASFESLPDVDLQVLSEARGRRLADLKIVLPLVFAAAPSGPEQVDRMKVTELLRTLYDQTRLCVRLMEKGMEDISIKMNNLTRTKHAVRAYHR